MLFHCYLLVTPYNFTPLIWHHLTWVLLFIYLYHIPLLGVRKASGSPEWGYGQAAGVRAADLGLSSTQTLAQGVTCMLFG